MSTLPLHPFKPKHPVLQAFLDYRARAAINDSHGSQGRDRLKKALAAGANPNALYSADVGTLLHAVAKKAMTLDRMTGHEVPMAQVLLDAGADPDRVAGQQRTTPFWWACYLFAHFHDDEVWDGMGLVRCLAERGNPDARHSVENFDDVTDMTAQGLLEEAKRVYFDEMTPGDLAVGELDGVLALCDARRCEILRERLSAVAGSARAPADDEDPPLPARPRF